jgi:hypothetical protein
MVGLPSWLVPDNQDRKGKLRKIERSYVGREMARRPSSGVERSGNPRQLRRTAEQIFTLSI